MTECHQTIRFAIGERPNQDGVREPEHRRSDADPEREGSDDGNREGGFASEPTDRKAEILRQVLQDAKVPAVPDLLLDPLHTAKRDERLPAGFIAAHPPAQVCLGLHLDVETQLVREVLLCTGTVNESAQPFPRVGQEAHRRPSACRLLDRVTLPQTALNR